MKIVADENVEAGLVAGLRQAGFDVADIKDSRPGIKDPDVLQIARESGAILLTNDKDFGELVYREQLLSKGVILLRLGRLTPMEKLETLRPVLARQDDLEGSFTVVSEKGTRIRKQVLG